MRVLLMGGTRFMGRYAIDGLLAAGHDVWVFNRGTRPLPDHPRVTAVLGDRNDPASHAVLSALDLDAVVDFSCYTPQQASNAVAALPDIGTYVLISTGAVYSPAAILPWGESTPLGPWVLWGDYAVNKLAAERVVTAARPTHSTVILRFPYVLGPGNYADREEFLFNRILDGAEVLIPGDGTAVQQVISARDAAAVAVRSLDLEGLGGAFNAANPDEFVSVVGLVHMCAEIAGREATVRHVGGGITGTGSDVFNAANSVFPFPAANYVLDTRAAEGSGLLPRVTPLAETLAESFDYLLTNPERRTWTRTQAETAALARL